MKKWFIKCPFCANEIKEWAIKCQYCWEFLDWRNQDKENNVSTTASWNIYYDMVSTIHCPTCWFTWKPWKVLKWNFFVEFILYWFMIIPWIIYSIRRRSKTTCCCPQCWNKIVEISKLNSEKASWTIWKTETGKDKKKKMWVWWRCLTIFGSIFLIWIIVSWNGTSNTTNKTTTNNKIAETVQERIDYFIKEFTLWEEKRDNFEKMECNWDCWNADISLYLKKLPTKEVDWTDLDSIARWQTLQLSRAIYKATNKETPAYVSVYINWTIKQKCKWLWNTIDFSYGNNGCIIY